MTITVCLIIGEAPTTEATNSNELTLGSKSPTNLEIDELSLKI